MDYAQCPICNLSLPITILVPIKVKHQGRIITVLICENCKHKKEAEAKGEKCD